MNAQNIFGQNDANDVAQWLANDTRMPHYAVQLQNGKWTVCTITSVPAYAKLDTMERFAYVGPNKAPKVKAPAQEEQPMALAA